VGAYYQRDLTLASDSFRQRPIGFATWTLNAIRGTLAAVMLVARGSREFANARLDWTLTFASKIWYLGVDRHGLAIDTRYIPGAQGPARPTKCIYLLVRGAFEAHGPSGFRVEGPSCLLLSDEQLEGGDGRRSMTFRASGARFTVVQVNVPDAYVVVTPEDGPPIVQVSASVWEAAERTLALAHTPEDAVFVRSITGLVQALVAEGILSEQANESARQRAPLGLQAIWKALRPIIERFDLLPTSKQVSDAAGVSPRSVDRYIADFIASFGLLGRGWRAGTRHLRVKIAVMLLSAADASIADVASAVGYRSPDAMARAFRDAGLPPPTAVQEAVREPAG
jgi:AraC-like DNA-binding protein